MAVTDLETLEETVQAIGEAIELRVAPMLNDASNLISPWATVTAVLRFAAGCALLDVRAHPDHRDGVVAMLRQAADLIETETSVKH